MSEGVKEQKDILLSASEVTMRFGGVTAVSGLSLAVPRGAVTGIIGPTARARQRPSTC